MNRGRSLNDRITLVAFSPRDDVFGQQPAEITELAPRKSGTSRMRFRIHDLVEVNVDDEFQRITETFEHLADVLQPVGKEIDSRAAQLRLVHSRKLSSEGMREFGEGIFLADNAVFDSLYGVRLEVRRPGEITLTSEHISLEWYVAALQLALLSQQTSLVHGAALERHGRAVFFPSWGGIGKTALVSKFVRELGWKLLGDDMVILTADGTCLAYPKAFVLYPYHRAVFPDVFSNGSGPAAPVFTNNWFSRITPLAKRILRRFPAALDFARRHNPQSTRVRPSQIFGSDKIAEQAKLNAVVWLDRIVGLSETLLIPAHRSLASRVMGSTMVELDPRCLRVLNVALGCGIIDARSFYAPWLEVLSQGLKVHRRFELRLPADLHVSRVPDAVRSCCNIDDFVGVRDERVSAAVA